MEGEGATLMHDHTHDVHVTNPHPEYDNLDPILVAVAKKICAGIHHEYDPDRSVFNVPNQQVPVIRLDLFEVVVDSTYAMINSVPLWYHHYRRLASAIELAKLVEEARARRQAIDPSEAGAETYDRQSGSAMSDCTVFEINHDFFGQIASAPAGFIETRLMDALRGRPQAIEELRLLFGIRVLTNRHHGDAMTINVNGHMAYTENTEGKEEP